MLNSQSLLSFAYIPYLRPNNPIIKLKNLLSRLLFFHITRLLTSCAGSTSSQLAGQTALGTQPNVATTCPGPNPCAGSTPYPHFAIFFNYRPVPFAISSGLGPNEPSFLILHSFLMKYFTLAKYPDKLFESRRHL